MGQITQRDATAAMRALASIGSGSSDPETFVRRSLAEIPALVASELTTFSFCDLDGGRRTVVSDVPNAISDDDVECFNRHFREHPLVRYHASHPDGGSHRISDALSRYEFRHSALFNDYYRHLGLDSVIAVPLYVDQRRLVSLVLNRGRRDFSERDRELLDLLRGPLAAMFRNSLELARAHAALRELRTAMESDGWAMMAVNASRQLVMISAGANALLAAWWPGEIIVAGTSLPQRVDTWLRREEKAVGIAGRRGFCPLALTRGSRTVNVRAFPDPDSPHDYLLFIRESRAMQRSDPSPGFRLTPRERTVLAWVAAGKTNQDIATILCASVRTIEKHLEHVFAKLGVETRTAAVMRALALAVVGKQR
ncbi:LuxR C-terminal-related transcriptional regulator [Accumulibacter sp.]|uniref:LuxR C-terminal-related transcriptional regulator n=1 Tax=Accumulibacter sp. TaxID=2053492 RepID=UPI0028C4F6FC|nr:LuxR C-terminal-related transcriptional regulator [Accumulibacter sp.]